MNPATNITVTCVRAANEQFSHEYQNQLQYLADTINGRPMNFPTLWPTPEGAVAGNDRREVFKLQTGLHNATTVTTAFSVWLASHEGRTLRIEIGGVEAEVKSIQDLEGLLTDPTQIKWATDTRRVQEF